eukprot:symbB.v1.2.006195.t1/scaffold355.1/size243294/5
MQRSVSCGTRLMVVGVAAFYSRHLMDMDLSTAGFGPTAGIHMHARVLFQRGDFGMLSLYNVIQRVQLLRKHLIGRPEAQDQRSNGRGRLLRAETVIIPRHVRPWELET